MIPPHWRDGEVAVLGFARSGVAAARWLASQGLRVYASDLSDSPSLRSSAREFDSDRVSIELGRHDTKRIGAAVVAVVSPGISPDEHVIESARSHGVEIVAELELAARALPSTRLIVITGTNGKSTTAALAGAMLDAAGMRSEVAGNIGRPLIEIAMEDSHPDWAVVEASSFQLHDCHTLTPAVGVVTNLSPDHLDRYPDLESYYADKRRLFANASGDSVWVLNGDQIEVADMASGARGKRLTWSLQRPADAWYDPVARLLRLGDNELLDRSALRLLGDHNVANALAATLASQVAGVSQQDIADALAEFQPLPHRLAVVAEVAGVLWINDSKATNVTSSLVAFRSMDRNFTALMGGRHKGEPYSRLADAARPFCKGVITFGEAAPRIAADLAGGCNVVIADSLEAAVTIASDTSTSGEAVLLSPACSSFDMFESYEQRGQRFEELVNSL